MHVKWIFKTIIIKSEKLGKKLKIKFNQKIILNFKKFINEASFSKFLSVFFFFFFFFFFLYKKKKKKKKKKKTDKNLEKEASFMNFLKFKMIFWLNLIFNFFPNFSDFIIIVLKIHLTCIFCLIRFFYLKSIFTLI